MMKAESPEELGHMIYTTYCKKYSVDLVRAVQEGMIPKRKLIEGQTYAGYSRNANMAKWSGGMFVYTRRKNGSSYEELIPHPEDDDGYDVFVPVGKVV